MTPPKGKKRMDEETEEQSMSDEGVGNLFSGGSGGGGSTSALAGWA
ncbi:hypothetical protein K377_08108, partial [Streptomyces sp. PsTaAH-137]